jgi:hypothetical protein
LTPGLKESDSAEASRLAARTSIWRPRTKAEVFGHDARSWGAM